MLIIFGQLMCFCFSECLLAFLVEVFLTRIGLRHGYIDEGFGYDGRGGCGFDRDVDYQVVLPTCRTKASTIITE